MKKVKLFIGIIILFMTAGCSSIESVQETSSSSVTTATDANFGKVVSDTVSEMADAVNKMKDTVSEELGDAKELKDSVSEKIEEMKEAVNKKIEEAKELWPASKDAVFVLGKDEVKLTYRFDSKKDIVTSIKIESKKIEEGLKNKNEAKKIVKSLEKISGVEASLDEEKGNLIIVIEINLKKFKFTEMKKSKNVIVKEIIEAGYLKGNEKEVIYSETKESILSSGFKEK